MNTTNNVKSFLAFTARVILVHTLTYFIFGLIASNVFHYANVFKQEIIRDYMIPMAEHNILIGPFMQPVRGLIFAVGLWPLRGFLIEKKRGWLILWGLLVTIGILSTPAASPGSIEGMLYTKLPVWYHLIGYPEIMLQTLTFSVWLVRWERQSVRRSEPEIKNVNPLVAEVVKAIMLACFAYMGYAVGGLLLVALTRTNVDVAAAGANFKMQFMFVVAFFVNAFTVFWITREWLRNHITLGAIFLLFWFLDALVPWLYQTFVFGSSFIPTTIMLGFFPAAIIAASMWISYRRSALQERR